MAGMAVRALGRAGWGTALAAVLLAGGPASAGGEINALVWCDHTDPALIEPFEKANDAKVNLKTYEGTGTALSLIEQSRPGDWDVLVIDGIDVQRAVDLGILDPLPREMLPLDTIFPEVRLEEAQSRDGKLYAVTEKFGYNTISYNRKAVKPEDLANLSALWSGRFKGRIAVYDYYLPLIGLMQVGLGKTTAGMTEADLPPIAEALGRLKDSVKLTGEVTASQTALATGEVDILFGGGEWVTAVLHAENPDLDWMIPAEGALRWSQSIGVFADSGQKELARKFVAWVLSPEGQARLATSSCFWGMPANSAAGAVLGPEEKRLLRWDSQAEYLKRAQLYPAPSAELDARMQEVWTGFLQR